MFDMDQFALTGRTALVIGGTGGIGREIALGYRAAGGGYFSRFRCRPVRQRRHPESGRRLSCLGDLTAGWMIACLVR